jgi:uncharacterized protein involved in exopolysaccharide biosynthesis/Mrp family chromosome partitioning ATPase
MKDAMNDEISISISELIGIIIKHFKLLILVFGIVVLVSILYIGFNKHPAKASTTIVVDPIRSLTSWDNLRPQARNVISEFQLLTSQNTISSTLEKLDLSKYTYKDGSDYQDLLSNTTKINVLQGAISVTPIAGTNSTIISISHKNPKFAEDFLQALIPVFESSILDYVKKILNQDLDSLFIEKQLVEKNLKANEVEIKKIQLHSKREQDYDTEKLMAIMSNQSLQETNNTIFTYSQIENFSLYQKFNQYIKQAALIVEYDNQITALKAFIASLHGAITIINAPSLAVENRESDDFLLLALGLAFGALLGLFSTFIAELFSDSIDDVQILEKAIKNESPIISIIPKGIEDSTFGVDVLDHPKSLSSLAYYNLSSFLLNNKRNKIYTFTSLGFLENTSRILINIAFYLAKCKKNVLVINAHPKTNEYQEFCAKITVSEEMHNLVQMESLELNQKPIPLDKGSGKIIIRTIDASENNLSQLLYSQEFADYLKYTSTIFDLVFIDGPTFSTSWNLLAVAKNTQGIILNIRKSVGSRKQLKSLIQTLKVSQIPLLGVIFNNIGGKPTRIELKEISAYMEKI